MDKHILLGVDMDFSPPTQSALRIVNRLFEQNTDSLHLLLLTVIPLPYDPSPSLMKARGIGQIRPQAPTSEQCSQAQDVLRRANAFLHLYSPDLVPQRIELVQRFGEPADEVVKAARKHQVDCIVIGSRGNSSIQNLRRMFAGSISHEIMRFAPCPVVLVILPQNPRLFNLVAWYEEAITHYLHEQPGVLTIMTPEEVTHMFVPPFPTSPVQQKKLTAAIQALEHLTHSGQLACQKVRGERQYIKGSMGH